MFLLLPLILNSVGFLTGAPDLKIVGGHPVSITERPFQVLIFRKSPIFEPGCGGSIINHRWILTAAHCVIDMRPRNMAVRTGSDTMDLDNDTETQWYRVDKAISHERFQDASWTMTNDIALIKTNRKIKFGPTVQPIKVRTKSPRASMEAIISGFGKTKETHNVMSHILKEVSVTVLDRKYCIKLLARITKKLGLSKTHFCAAYLSGGRDACQGDSGGPITIGDSLAGVVSWGIGCAHKLIPAFYTDVAQFIPWISRTVKRYTKSFRSCKAGGYKKG